MNKLFAAYLAALLAAAAAQASEYHVATSGNDRNPGTAAQPFLTVQHAAETAQPGDVITVHAGTYRERIDPPRGGESDARRIVYRAAPGEKVTITGSEIVKNWEHISNDTWKVTVPESLFGDFNPYREIIHGDWFNPQGRVHHRGCVYLNGNWMDEAPNKAAVMKPPGKIPQWFAEAPGEAAGGCVVNIEWFQAGDGPKISAVNSMAKKGTQPAASSDGGQCVGFIVEGDWLRYDGVDFGSGTGQVEFRVASPFPALIEMRSERKDGELLGTAEIGATGDWQKWATVSARIKSVSGKKNIYLVFKKPQAKDGQTIIYAQFPGVDPNRADAEINVRPTVFTPSRTGINYLTVRGFVLRNAATNWASPSEGQEGLITAYWDKGWIIEQNEVCYSKCAGITLGKNHDDGDGRNYGTGGFFNTIKDAQSINGWNKANIGSHIVRYNHVHDCEEAGIDGSFGAIYSRVIGNDIHDIHVRHIYDGAEMAGIKFHAAVDTVIQGNHIYRAIRGMWLDWMTQGAEVQDNFFHDNEMIDLTMEVSHGPVLFANNIFGSEPNQNWSILLNAQNNLVAHNLFANRSEECNGDGRQTPYFRPHTTETLGMAGCGPGNSFYYNNLFFSSKGNALPAFLEGNVFWNDPTPAARDKAAIVLAQDAAPQFTVIQKSDGWYVEFAADAKWGTERRRKIVTSQLAGKATLSGQPFENPDGSPINIGADYFGHARDAANPFPGPFEIKAGGKQSIKVWPRPGDLERGTVSAN